MPLRDFLPLIMAPSATITDAPEYGLSTPITIRRVTPRTGREWAMNKNQPPNMPAITAQFDSIEQRIANIERALDRS